MAASRESTISPVPLTGWVSLHPAALAYHAGELPIDAAKGAPRRRSRALASALATANESWGNPVSRELDRWLAGADAIVTGQQPGLLGGPLLTLIKACAVAAEVRRRRDAGRDAVGFLWLANADDDLAEMGWARVAAGDEVLEAREPEWRRGGVTAGAARLGAVCSELLTRLGDAHGSEHTREAIAWAATCYAAGEPLAAATARFLARALRGAGVIIVDGLEPELARAAADVTETVLRRLPEANAVVAAGAGAMSDRGWPVPFAPAPQRLPIYRLAGGHRQRLAGKDGTCPDAVLREHAADPARFAPNVWLRSLVQDAALGSACVLLGGGELAYHLQAAALWELAGLPHPEWRLRPHVTVVTAGERRLAQALRLTPRHVLESRMPAHLLDDTRVRRELARLRRTLDPPLAALDEAVAAELPSLKGDLVATRDRMAGALTWLEQRAGAAAARAAEVDAGRWRRLSAFLRPHRKPQERALSVLAPLLRLGLDWPAQLVEAIDPGHPGMHLLHWEEGGSW